MKAKRLFAAVLSMAIAASAVAGLAACGTETQYLDTWTTSAEGHWHASVDNPDIIGDYGDHTFKDGKCTVCEYPDPNYNPGGGDGGDGGSGDTGGGGGSDIGGGGGGSSDEELIGTEDLGIRLICESRGWDADPAYFVQDSEWGYDGAHYQLIINLNSGDQFCIAETLSTDSEVWYNYGNEYFKFSQGIFTEQASDVGGSNFVVVSDGSYTFDFYVGTKIDGNEEHAHIDAKITGTDLDLGGGGGDVGGGDHSTWDTLTIHYHNAKDWANPYAYSWETGYETKFLGNWPGTPATAESDGWVKITYQVDPAARGSLMIIFNDGKENGADQTGDIDISGITNNEAWIAKDESVHATQAEALAAEGTAQETTYTFYFYNAGGWGTVKIWTWGAFATAGAWSDAPTMEAATELGNGWFKYTYTGYASKVEGKSLSVIVFNGSNDSQRVTIGNTSGQDAVADSGDPITITATTYYISGAQNGKYSTTKEDIHA